MRLLACVLLISLAGCPGNTTAPTPTPAAPPAPAPPVDVAALASRTLDAREAREHSKALAGRRVRCAGQLIATKWSEVDLRDWGVAQSDPRYQSESSLVVPLAPGKTTAAEWRPYLYAEVVVEGVIAADGTLTADAIDGRVVGFDPAVAPITVRLAQHERDRRFDTEVVVLGRIVAGGGPRIVGEPEPLALEASGANGWPAVELSWWGPGHPGPALNGQDAVVRGYLREARYAPAGIYYTYLQVRAARPATDEDRKRALDAPADATPPPQKKDPDDGRE